jgi:hypothetical protein
MEKGVKEVVTKKTEVILSSKYDRTNPTNKYDTKLEFILYVNAKVMFI